MENIASSPSEWIASPDPRVSPDAPLSLGDALTDAAARWGDKEAVVYRHQPAIADAVWTYAQLDEDASQLAAALAELGFLPGERLAIWGPNHPEWVLLEYAIAKAGLVLVALNPLYKLAELEFALRDSRAVGIFHADRIGTATPAHIISEARKALPGLRHVHSFSDIMTKLMPMAGDPITPIGVDPHSLFMIQYTSGTTGVPKAVRLSHRAITVTARNSYLAWGLAEHSRVCPGFPLFHVGGSGNSIPGAALVGATTLPLHIFKPAVTLDVLEREECTAFIGVPTMLIAMLDDPSLPARSLPNLKTIILGGAPVTKSLLRRCEDVLGANVINCYGQTETCGVTTTTTLADSAETKTQTSGAPLIGVSVAIRDDRGCAVPRGEIGELHYSGPGGMLGYGSTPENADSLPAQHWIASGDLATMNADGFVAIVGRKKEMIIRGGENLSPVEIESYMKDHEAIRDVAVVGVPDAKYGEVACAVVSIRRGIAISGSEIQQWCAGRISRWKVPEYVEFVDEFPLTPSGKIQKFILQQQIAKRLGLVADLPTNDNIGEDAQT
jgi:fatty-acyl-CoA synthase